MSTVAVSVPVSWVAGGRAFSRTVPLRFPDATPADEIAARCAIIREAYRWQGTPWHHGAAVLGAGVDCAQFLRVAYQAAGLIPAEWRTDDYPMDWAEHRSGERFLEHVLRWGRPIAEADALPGDCVLWRWGRTLSHGALVVGWPAIIHAQRGQGVTEDDGVANRKLAHLGTDARPRRREFFSLFAARGAAA